MKTAPDFAKALNEGQKFVFSRTKRTASWRNTTIINGDLLVEAGRLKDALSENIMIFGSGTVVSQLAQNGLIDEFQLIVQPVVLGDGRTMFADGSKMLSFKLVESRTFESGRMFVRYQPK